MRDSVRSQPKQFRRAVAGSVAVHLVLAVGVILSVRSGGRAKPALSPQPTVDTRANEVSLRMSAAEIVLAPDEPVRPADPPAGVPEAPGDSRPAADETLTRPPLRTFVPGALPNEVLALIRRPRGVADRDVRPAGGSAGVPFHGAMAKGQSVVYVLDCSGSMGAFGKLDVARAALVATLRRQPGDARFQVVAYNSTAKSVLPGGCVAASPANVSAAEAALAGLAAAGRSSHAEGVRAAAALRPDVVVLLTDADDLNAAQFRSALAAAGKPVAVCVARVSADGVAAPRELR